MARTRQLQEMRADVRKRSDMENSLFVSDSEIDGYLNEGITALYDLLRGAFGDEYFEKESSPSTSAGVATVPLPADFLSLTGLWWEQGTDDPVRIEKYTPADARLMFASTGWSYGGAVRYRIQAGNLRFVPTPNGVHQLRMSYIPAPARLVGNTDTLDGYSGWEDYPIWHATMKCISKQEGDVSIAMTQMQLLEKRIAESADRDDNEPARVQRKRSRRSRAPGLWPWE